MWAQWIQLVWLVVDSHWHTNISCCCLACHWQYWVPIQHRCLLSSIYRSVICLTHALGWKLQASRSNGGHSGDCLKKISYTFVSLLIRNSLAQDEAAVSRVGLLRVLLTGFLMSTTAACFAMEAKTAWKRKCLCMNHALCARRRNRPYKTCCGACAANRMWKDCKTGRYRWHTTECDLRQDILHALETDAFVPSHCEKQRTNACAYVSLLHGDSDVWFLYALLLHLIQRFGQKIHSFGLKAVNFVHR